MKGGMASTAAGGGSFVPPSVQEIAQLFPQLEVLELIGQGGMGAVYRARQPGLDRLVALKILPPRTGTDPGFADRFAREARALAKLSHPNIVAVYDFGQTGGLHYFIMEYIEGPNLRQLEKAAKLTPAEALKIIPQICEALQFAHDEGIVHRDIKPENVLLDKKGRVKIADFGLAKLLGQEPQQFRLTGTRDVMGTPHYMAPEQVEHPQAVDHRADIYSLGVVFYEMLTGELPLGRFGPPSSRARDVQIDVRLDEVVLRALEREPERRYQHASEVKTDVENIAGQSSPPPPPIAKARRESLEKEVRAPAIGLLATGILNWVLLPVTMILLIKLAARAFPLGHWPAVQGLSMMLLLLFIAAPFVLCSFLIYAALKMQRFESYRGAVASSILAMLVAPGNLVGLPIGIWALITLARREVRARFSEVEASLPPGRVEANRRLARRVLACSGLGVLVVTVLLTGWAWHRSPDSPPSVPRLLAAPTPSDRPLAQELQPMHDGSFLASCTTTQVFRLFEVRPHPGVENCVVLYQAQLRTEGLSGRAYLEMWCRLPGQGESFSRGLDNTVSGTTDWVTTQTPFFLKQGENADLFRLNLVVEGPGKVLMRNIRLEAAPNR